MIRRQEKREKRQQHVRNGENANEGLFLLGFSKRKEKILIKKLRNNLFYICISNKKQNNSMFKKFAKYILIYK